MDILTESKLTESKRIDLPYIELTCRKNPEVKECCIILHGNYYEYRNISEYDSDDNPEGVMKHYKSNWTLTQMRSDIIAVDIFYNNLDDTWAVGIEGRIRKLEWDFKYPKDARELYRQLMDYFTTR